MAQQAGERHAMQRTARRGGGVWASMCASIQIRPKRTARRMAAATPLQVPMAQEWSPPSTSGKALRSMMILHAS